jgi:hypothetical protein
MSCILEDFMQSAMTRDLPYDTAMQLEETRRKISDSSGGISSGELRTATLGLIRKLDLRGDGADIGSGFWKRIVSRRSPDST